MASARELSREFGGGPASLLGFGFLVVWPVWAEITVFIFSCGIVGITDLGLPCRACGQTWLLLFWLATFAGDMT